jgi:hypothetical protein
MYLTGTCDENSEVDCATQQLQHQIMEVQKEAQEAAATSEKEANARRLSQQQAGRAEAAQLAAEAAAATERETARAAVAKAAEMEKERAQAAEAVMEQREINQALLDVKSKESEELRLRLDVAEKQAHRQMVEREGLEQKLRQQEEQEKISAKIEEEKQATLKEQQTTAHPTSDSAKEATGKILPHKTPSTNPLTFYHLGTGTILLGVLALAGLGFGVLRTKKASDGADQKQGILATPSSSQFVSYSPATRVNQVFQKRSPYEDQQIHQKMQLIPLDTPLPRTGGMLTTPIPMQQVSRLR